jgi:hypothetical protein
LLDIAQTVSALIRPHRPDCASIGTSLRGNPNRSVARRENSFREMSTKSRSPVSMMRSSPFLWS